MRPDSLLQMWKNCLIDRQLPPPINANKTDISVCVSFINDTICMSYEEPNGKFRFLTVGYGDSFSIKDARGIQQFVRSGAGGNSHLFRFFFTEHGQVMLCNYKGTLSSNK